MRISLYVALAVLVLASAAGAQVTSISGTVYDIAGIPLPGVTVWYNDWQAVTDGNGNYALQGTSSVPNEDPAAPSAESTSWGRLKAGFRQAAKTQTPSKAAPGARDYDPGPGFLNFEAPGHWSAWHDLTAQSGVISRNATLPDSVGPRYGEALLPEHFRLIWRAQPLLPRLLSYRSQDLPIPVDGDMDSPADWALVQASIDRLNETLSDLVGGPTLELLPGNGHPSRVPPHQGIYIYHASNQNMGDPIENSSDNPEYIIGGNVYLMNSNFIQSNGRSLDHELLYRLQNSNT